MVCKKCGSPLMDTDKFCQYCGTPVDAASQKPASNCANDRNDGTGMDTTFDFTDTKPESGRSPRNTGKNRRLPLIIGGIAAAVAVVLIAVLLITGRPSVKVAAALSASAGEFTKVSQAMSVSELPELFQKDSISQDLDIAIQSVNEDFMGTSALEGLGMSLKADLSLPKHELGLQIVPYFGSVEICNLSLAMREDMVYFALPEILPDPYYGISTMTIIRDLQALGAPMDEVEDVAFNFFELAEMVQEETEAASEASQKALADASQALLGSLEVEKDGKRSIRVNGTNTKCTAYKVTVPQDAMEDWFKAVEDSFTAVDQEAMVEMVLEGMNMPRDLIRDILDEMAYSTVEPDFDDVYDVIDELGDLVLDIYISGGKVSAVKSEADVFDTELEVSLYIGGGDNYADDITFEMTADGESLTLESSGNHTGKGGVFTDETVISVPYGSEIVMETELESKDGALSFAMEVDGETMLELEGQFQAKSSGMTLNLDALTLYDGYSGEMMTLSMNYSISDYQRRVKEDDVRLLSTMTEDDLQDIVEQAEENGIAWIYGLMEQIPELMYMF